MTVQLLHNSPLSLALTAINISHGNLGEDHPTPTEELPQDKRELIYKVANKYYHSSVLEQLSYTFLIQGTTRAVLQELARHRTAKLTVQSTRFALKKIMKGETHFLYDVSENPELAPIVESQLEQIKKLLESGTPNDKIKGIIPEALKTELIWTIDGRNLQNFLDLRAQPGVYPPMQRLAAELYNNLPDTHKFLYKEFLCEKMFSSQDKDVAYPVDEKTWNENKVEGKEINA